MPALFFAGILKLVADLGAGLLVGRLAIGVLLAAGLGIGVCDLFMLDGGRSTGADIVDDVRDIGGGCEGWPYWPWIYCCWGPWGICG